MKKKIIIAVVVIVALIIGVLGYMVISDMGQEDKLKTEISEISDLSNAENIDIDEINKRLDRTVTKGDYAKVEDAFKSYLRDNFDNSIEIADLINDERITTLLTADNYKTDGKEFIESKKYISTTRQKLEECKEKYSEYMTKEKAMSYIEDKGLDSYYVDLYKEEYVGDMKTANEDKTVEDSINQIIELLNVSEEVINFLTENSSSWHIEEDLVVFDTDELSNRYLDLINKIK